MVSTTGGVKAVSMPSSVAFAEVAEVYGKDFGTKPHRGQYSAAVQSSSQQSPKASKRQSKACGSSMDHAVMEEYIRGGTQEYDVQHETHHQHNNDNSNLVWMPHSGSGGSGSSSASDLLITPDQRSFLAEQQPIPKQTEAANSDGLAVYPHSPAAGMNRQPEEGSAASLLDVAVFIFSGVLLIFMMEQLVQIGIHLGLQNRYYTGPTGGGGMHL
jgi:hypothetical protein